MTKELFNYPTKSENCANCKRAKRGYWLLSFNGNWCPSLYFCVCSKGKLLDPSNPEHYEKCPYFKRKEVE